MSKPPLLSSTILLPLVTLLLTSLPFLVISQSQPSEQEILLTIKQQWGDQTFFQSWNTSVPHCQWQGITCSDEIVTGISITNQDIGAQIPPSICDLKNLTALVLSYNKLPGEFPTSLYKCANLQYLDISQNSFVGVLPDDINSLSSQIQYLDLSSNNFTGDVPSSIGQLKGLTYLNLGSNLFNGTFPSELGNLVNLEELVLSYNPFFAPMKLPMEFGRLKRLTYLWMTDCNLVGEIPESFGNMSSLVHLDLVQNNLVGQIPSELFLLKNLTDLYLYKNQLSGGLPESIQAFNLKEIDVSMNNLTGTIPEGIGSLPNLEVLNLFSNQFHGVLPPSIGKIPTLRTLKIWGNSFSGPLPPELGLHSKLEDFEVSENGFTGHLPENLCSGKRLLGVVASNNRLNGSIPSSLGQCNALRTVQLYNNSFEGEVPDGIWTLQNMSIVLLSQNRFSGQLPEKLNWNLTIIDVSNNRFSGQIPQGLQNWRNVRKLNASNNLITGTVPLELTSLSELEVLWLDGNQLSGELPENIISWKRLTSLNLANNKLSGPIPPALGSLPVLSSLDLSNNQFSGQIPPQLGNLPLTSLNVSSNKLTGVLPRGLDNDAYENSFFNTKLCSNNGVSNLPRCYYKTDAKKLSSKYLALISVLVLVAFVAAVYFTWFTIKELRKRSREELASWKLTSFHRVDFTEEKILDSLTESNLVGSGGYGKVYRVPINNKTGECVAVKKIWSNRKLSATSEKEFLAEVEILGTIRHLNIIKLLCCISSEDSKLLVYEYMENQSLDKWIHGRKQKPGSPTDGLVSQMSLDWPARLKIAIGAAQGLSYMHHDCSPPIIHRDVKSSNILLDSNFEAKIADFGLAKILAKPGGEPHTVSAVAGSFGYMAPEYCYTTKVNEKIDVYSFGVVLLELVTGKMPHTGDEYSNLAEWAWRHCSNDKPIVELLDEELKDPLYLEEITKVFNLGLMCTNTLPSSRPSMKEVLQVLRKCSPLEGSGRKKSSNDYDSAPLLGSGKYTDSCKSSKRTVDEDDYSMV